MTEAEETHKLVTDYIEMMCASDVDGIIALFAANATAEDPVGGDVQNGKQAIEAFYAKNAPLLQVELCGPICVAGNSVAFPILAELSMGGSKSYLNAIDTFEFGEDGKIVRMRAFWNPAEMRPQR
ncbi:Nuclear transport factor 2 [Halieaceae bacterium IMCC14734]|uniref:Nuclear transport factor 2 n=1 Tax=Candidatus Litorirhabdus singularis TaxID=2518993 RepID=A0ABT3TBH0_9GAMM|nr:nuclear transport factor 2 family protein [Candidatus Litorirhabdus singularis]MCX2979633.1 Nuclear transport factor 2 [Candidatus Litorirhabdus singularis]